MLLSAFWIHTEPRIACIPQVWLAFQTPALTVPSPIVSMSQCLNVSMSQCLNVSIGYDLTAWCGFTLSLLSPGIAHPNFTGTVIDYETKTLH